MTEKGYEIPLYRTVDPDDLLDFHAARLLILLEVCGSGDRSRRIDGRTKLAKLDFFLRYPRFLEEAHRHLAEQGRLSHPFIASAPEREAPMIRYRYGPWDPSYRDYLGFLESRGLLRVVGTDVEGYSLTPSGRRVAGSLMSRPVFAPLVERARNMAGNLSEWTGSELKDFIYRAFAKEVGELSYREVIEP